MARDVFACNGAGNEVDYDEALSFGRCFGKNVRVVDANHETDSTGKRVSDVVADRLEVTVFHGEGSVGVDCDT